MELQIGHTYHLADSRRHTNLVPIPPHGGISSWWEAYCGACGWVGPQRETKSAADDDATAHDSASNNDLGEQPKL